MATIRPIFILSAPRSGSTLVQRVLSSHSAVATTSEPWLLLPLLAPLYERLPGHGGRDPLIHAAIADFCAELPQGVEDYRSAVRETVLDLYARAAPGTATHFVDKTPLYHLVIDEIVRTFPDGRFLFLFRNPLSVLASSIELFDSGRWEVSRYHMALFQSLVDLVSAWERHGSRACKVRFEDLVAGGEQGWRAVTDYLQLPWEPEMLRTFSHVNLRGRMGDPTGTHAYSALSTEPVTKWRRSISNPLRRAWCHRYLQWIGGERLAAMGYDLDDLDRQLAQTGNTGARVVDDAYRMGKSLVREVIKAHVPTSASRASTWSAVLRPGLE